MKASKQRETKISRPQTKKIEEGIDLYIEKKRWGCFRKKEVIKKEKEKIVDQILKIGFPC